MRLGTLILILLPFLAVAQEQKAVPTFESDEWNTLDFTQEDKIYNRSVWTFVDNPALAGFDRKLNISYGYQAKHLSIGVPNKKMNLVLAFQQHQATIDFAFGKRKNWGVGIAYQNVKEALFNYHRISWSHSYRIKIKAHSLIFGFAPSLYLSQADFNSGFFTYSDQFDPRLGVIFHTQEASRSNRIAVIAFNSGMTYSWKRLLFGYSFQFGPTGKYAFTAYPDSHFYHKIRTTYRFKIDKDVTISPEVVAYNNDLDIWRFTPLLTITYKNLAYGQLSINDLNKVGFRFGYTLRNTIAIEIGTTSFFHEQTAKASGLASAYVGFRYQLNKKQK